jgi:hypothetical protein
VTLKYEGDKLLKIKPDIKTVRFEDYLRGDDIMANIKNICIDMYDYYVPSSRNSMLHFTIAPSQKYLDRDDINWNKEKIKIVKVRVKGYMPGGKSGEYEVHVQMDKVTKEQLDNPTYRDDVFSAQYVVNLKNKLSVKNFFQMIDMFRMLNWSR